MYISIYIFGRFSSSGNEEKKIIIIGGEENFLRFLQCVKPKKNE